MSPVYSDIHLDITLMQSAVMQRAASIALLILVTIAFAVSLVMVQRVVPVSSPIFVLVAMLALLGWFGIARPIFLPPVPLPFRRLHKWEIDGKFYRAVGAIWFGRCLRTTPLRYLNMSVYLERTSLGSSEVYRQVEGAEAIHWWVMLSTVPYLVHAALIRRPDVVAGFSIVHLGLHVYPIMNLRFVRSRMDQYLARIAARQSTSTGLSMGVEQRRVPAVDVDRRGETLENA